MPIGTVKNSFNDRGFTFVAVPDSADVFLHITKIRKGEDPKGYVRGAQVELEIAGARGQQDPGARRSPGFGACHGC